MEAKKQIRIRLWILFTLVILSGVLSFYYMRTIAQNSEVIILDNYNTLVYTREMRTVLDENQLPLPVSARRKLLAALVKEENNITEKGEKEIVQKLRNQADVLNSPAASLGQMQQANREARKAIREIEEINMDAALRKHDHAQQTVKNATIYLVLVGTVTFLILFSFLFNLPDLIESSVEGDKSQHKKNKEDYF